MFTLKDAERAIDELDCDCTPEKLLVGMNVENEHTDDPIEAAKIAYDHIEEYPNYYEALKKMEKSLQSRIAEKPKGGKS